MLKNIFKKGIIENKIFTGLVVLLMPVILYAVLDIKHNSSSDAINVAEMFSGCFTFSSAILLWITLILQQEANEKQSVENHFYKMLEIARDNSNSTKSKDKAGRYVFKQICDDIDLIYKVINDYCNSYRGNERHPSKLEQIAISWLIVFYGLSDKTLPVLLKEIAKISALIASEQFFHVIELRKLCGCKENGWIRFDGYQSILAHYFRHLFQTVQYINKQNVIDYDEKYHYIRTLRAQLNTFELIVLFYNCFSPYGSEWEPDIFDVSDKDNNYKSTFLTYSNHIKLVRDKSGKLVDHDECINNQLITKYQFFRNITMPLGNDLKVENFFPMIEYEYSNICTSKDERDKLDKIYKKYNRKSS